MLSTICDTRNQIAYNRRGSVLAFQFTVEYGDTQVSQVHLVWRRGVPVNERASSTKKQNEPGTFAGMWYHSVNDSLP